MKNAKWTAALLGGLALGALAPATASAQPVDLDALAGPLLNSPCNLAQVERTLQANPTGNKMAPELAGQIAAEKKKNPARYEQFRQIYDNPAERQAKYQMYKGMAQHPDKKPTPEQIASYQELSKAIAANCSRY